MLCVVSGFWSPLPICSISDLFFSRAFGFVNVPMGLSARGHHTKFKENMKESQRRQSKKQMCILELGTVQFTNSHISYLAHIYMA